MQNAASQKIIIFPKFRHNDIITSSKNYAIKYLIKEVGVKNELGEYDYVVEDISDNPEYKGRIHNISIKKVDEWGVLVERNNVDWSEDVEAAIRLLKDIAEEQEKDYCPYNANDLRKAAQYLEICRHQNTWKPSEEQVEYLRHGIELFRKYASYCPVCLLELYEDLKKLM